VSLVLADGRVTEHEAACLRSLAATFGLDAGEARRLVTDGLARWHQARASALDRTASGRLEAATLGGEPRAPGGRPGRPAPGDVVGGKLRIEALLGQGGFGAVYRARHLELDEDVALKVLHTAAGDREKAEQRFLREVKLARAFAHRYAVPIREFGRDPAHGPYFTMDLVPGRTLERIVEEEGPQPPRRVVRLASQALEALEEAHRVGIVHRDLKPANLMVTTGPTGEEEVRVLDFGVAKAVSSARQEDLRLTRAGGLVGTPTYMSPEQAQGKELDARSDLYSMAVVVYEALCGCLPYAIDPDTDDVQRAMLFQILAEAPRDPLALQPDLPPAMGKVLLETLEKEPAARAPDARTLRERLAAALAEAPAAGPPRLGSGLTGWLKRLGSQG
jgi:eukaryotic-like serine/threonine-protein kinase